MTHQSKLLLTLLHGAGIGAIAMTGSNLISTDAVAGISNTKHNLTRTGNDNKMTGGATAEVCVFCHTPHGADVSSTENPPLWNKKLPAGGSYTTYASMGSSSLDAGQNGGYTTTGSISLACLSCHDGAQAMDNMINAPGSGNYQTNGGNANGMTGTSWAWDTGTNSRVNAEGILLSGVVTNIGTDLKNDHPIGIMYCGGFSGAVGPGTCRDGDFKTMTASGSTWYVETAGNSTKDKSDMILYNRDFGGTTAPSVECGTCHDPHVETKATNETAFLRVSQASSGLCLACHNK